MLNIHYQIPYVRNLDTLWLFVCNKTLVFRQTDLPVNTCKYRNVLILGELVNVRTLINDLVEFIESA